MDKQEMEIQDEHIYFLVLGKNSFAGNHSKILFNAFNVQLF